MRVRFTTLALLAVTAGGAVSSAAQTSVDLSRPPLTARAIPLTDGAIVAPLLSRPDEVARQDELKQWMHDFVHWKNWFAQWANKPEPGLFRRHRGRPQRPEPPPWLFDRCDAVEDDIDIVIEGCILLAEWGRNNTAAQAASLRVAASARKEKQKTTFWEHVHLEALWAAMQSGSNPYGLVGMHVTTTVKGRFQIFIAPGVMMLNVPTSDGRRQWKPAANYGMAYSLFDFTFPGKRPAQLHVNFAKAWLLSSGPMVTSDSGDFVGLSITFKKKR